ncbi:molecular chaperone [Serratia sp. AKBS12]|uniref:fimbrial biogenesis chaperone n=1 Tax=Serratia sp. AKBS12 TaxID=2974597 RepID=UPI0021660A1D|nr:molecular chaperone [Serratia sp. AKBS12]MCS3407305.1 molecular chaperone [Serratia sp. AKBS12]HEI8868462.1 molecular chaperone [Serratia odorifera]
MRIFLFSLLVVVSLIGQLAHASVVLTGTRIIYQAQLKEKTLHFTNKGSNPYIVQLNIEENLSDNKNSDMFVVTPNVFRIEPGKAQTVRLIYTGNKTQDGKEQISLLSFSQLPAVNTDKSGANSLVLAITSKVKIFYRPQASSRGAADIAEQLTFRQQGKYMIVSNPSSYFAVIRSASLSLNNKTFPLANSLMIPPGETEKWPIPAALSHLQGSTLILSLVNDYGVDVRTERRL